MGRLGRATKLSVHRAITGIGGDESKACGCNSRLVNFYRLGNTKKFSSLAYHYGENQFNDTEKLQKQMITSKTKRALAKAKAEALAKAAKKVESVKRSQTDRAKEKLSRKQFVAVSQVYRAFKRIDVSAYRIQGSLTTANLRKSDGVKVAQFDTRATGSTLWVTRGEYGVSAIIGKEGKHEGTRFLQSGNFALAFGKYVIGVLKNYGELAKFVTRKGKKEAGVGTGERNKGFKFTHRLGLENTKRGYALATNGTKVIGLEQATRTRGVELNGFKLTAKAK